MRGSDGRRARARVRTARWLVAATALVALALLTSTAAAALPVPPAPATPTGGHWRDTITKVAVEEGVEQRFDGPWTTTDQHSVVLVTAAGDPESRFGQRCILDAGMSGQPASPASQASTTSQQRAGASSLPGQATDGAAFTQRRAATGMHGLTSTRGPQPASHATSSMPRVAVGQSPPPPAPHRRAASAQHVAESHHQITCCWPATEASGLTGHRRLRQPASPLAMSC